MNRTNQVIRQAISLGSFNKETQILGMLEIISETLAMIYDKMEGKEDDKKVCEKTNTD